MARMEIKLKKIRILFFLLIFILMNVGCSNSKMDVKGDTIKKDVSIKDDFIALTEIKDGRPNIYVIVKSMESSYWKVVLAGTKQAGIDLDCNIYAAGSYLETEWELQEAYMNLAVERGADAIILGPDNSALLASAVSRIHNDGIPVIIVDTIVNTDDYDVCYMTDNLQAGENAAREMLRMLQEKGHKDNENVQVAIQLGARASQTINERLAGFCQYWTKYAPENWEVVDEIICNDGDEPFAKSLSIDFFQRYPDIDGVFGTDNASSMGYSSAIMSMDNKDVVMIGFDYSPEVAEIVESGIYDVAIMLQRQYQMGYKGVESALRIKNGSSEGVKFVDTGVAVLNQDTFDTEEIAEIIKNNRGE